MDARCRYLVQREREPLMAAPHIAPLPGSETPMFVALLVLVMLVAVPLLSLRYGVDSRHVGTGERRSNW
jgi:hypothetical protein